MREQFSGQGDWRPRVEELIKKLQDDPEYRTRIKADPERELEQLGLPESVRDDILYGFKVELQCRITCIKATSECTRSAYT
jgi:hypothetical protein